ncbi:MFS transporter [Actinomadura graeca]|uniref:MFS transporter n=1 Tax=Actinomadura graeca TaxID=2750812 RepID=A0ABX8QQW0_9ACTN|nr:MFS transporter [Actinomadura graeca]QXJ21163.1 MFS transporter [Actinomadura graeca]
MSTTPQPPLEQVPETGTRRAALTTGTLVGATLAGLVGQLALAVPGVLNGLFQADLGPSSSQLTWISAAFLVPVTLLELTFGVLGDLFGRKRLLMIGAAVTAFGEFVSVLTPGAGTSTGGRVAVLWVGQALAGIGAAMLFPTALAMVAAGTFTARERARGLAVWGVAVPLGGTVSVLLGGAVSKLEFNGSETASWRWTLLIVLGVALVSLAVTALCTTDSSAPEGRSLDVPGQVTIAIALFALLFAVVQSPSDGWGDPLILGALAVAAVFFVLFVVAETRSTAPLLQLRLFRDRNFAIVSIITVVAMFAQLGTGYAVSIRMAVIQGHSPLDVAIGMLPLTAGAVAMLPFNAWMLRRYPAKWLLVLGTSLLAVGAFWAAAIPAAHTSTGSVALPMLASGFGFGISVTAATAVAVNSVPPHLAGMASGTTSMLRDFGFTLGPTVLGAIALSRAESAIRDKVAASPALQSALAAFNASADKAPPGDRAAVQGAIEGVNSGPLGAVSVPATVPGPDGSPIPFNPLKGVAFDSLDHAYSLAFVICGVCALVSTLLGAVFLPRTKPDPR